MIDFLLCFTYLPCSILVKGSNPPMFLERWKCQTEFVIFETFFFCLFFPVSNGDVILFHFPKSFLRYTRIFIFSFPFATSLIPDDYINYFENTWFFSSVLFGSLPLRSEEMDRQSSSCTLLVFWFLRFERTQSPFSLLVLLTEQQKNAINKRKRNSGDNRNFCDHLQEYWISRAYTRIMENSLSAYVNKNWRKKKLIRMNWKFNFSFSGPSVSLVFSNWTAGGGKNEFSSVIQ